MRVDLVYVWGRRPLGFLTLLACAHLHVHACFLFPATRMLLQFWSVVN